MDLIPGFNDVLQWLNDTAQTLMSSTESLAKSLADYIDLLQKRIEAITGVIEKIIDLIQKFFEIFPQGGGLYILKVPWAAGGNDYFKNALNTPGGPSSSVIGYTAGFVFLAGGLDTRAQAAAKATLKSLEFIFG